MLFVVCFHSCDMFFKIFIVTERNLLELELKLNSYKIIYITSSVMIIILFCLPQSFIKVCENTLHVGIIF